MKQVDTYDIDIYSRYGSSPSIVPLVHAPANHNGTTAATGTTPQNARDT